MTEGAAVERFYGRWAGLYDLLATRTPGIGPVRERAVEALAVGLGDTVVEVGCGTGANLRLLRERVGPRGRVVGVDLTPGMLVRARQRVGRAGWKNVDLVRGDASELPMAEADAVLATFVVGMLEDPGDAVRRWAAVLGHGGRVALLDAAPRGRGGPLDAAFRLFVAATAPPTFQLRYAESPASTLRARIGAARTALAAEVDLVSDERFGHGFLRLTVGRRP